MRSSMTQPTENLGVSEEGKLRIVENLLKVQLHESKAKDEEVYILFYPRIGG